MNNEGKISYGAVMSYKEAGERLGMHPNTVLSAEKRAFEKIRRRHPWLADFLEESINKRENRK